MIVEEVRGIDCQDTETRDCNYSHRDSGSISSSSKDINCKTCVSSCEKRTFKRLGREECNNCCLCLCLSLSLSLYREEKRERTSLQGREKKEETTREQGTSKA